MADGITAVADIVVNRRRGELLWPTAEFGDVWPF